jgi:holo-[acyl-carrier protein] synthase
VPSRTTAPQRQLTELLERTLPQALVTGTLPVGVGVDVVDLDSFERQLHVGGERFLARLLIPTEIELCDGRLARLATRVAAKEAVVKALRCGFRGVGWHEVEIVTAANGAPSVRLHRRAAAKAARLGVERLHLSLAHEGRLAVAIAIADAATMSQPCAVAAGGEHR